MRILNFVGILFLPIREFSNLKMGYFYYVKIFGNDNLFQTGEISDDEEDGLVIVEDESGMQQHVGLPG